MNSVQKIVAQETDFPNQDIVTDRAGMEVNASGWEWTMNAMSGSKTLNFRPFSSLPRAIFLSIVMFVAERIRLSSPDDVRNNFYTLRHLLRSKIFIEEATAGRVISTAFFFELRSSNDLEVWRLHYVRAWYRWCTKQGFPQFSRDTANLLDDLVIGGNEKGRAVRTRDPLTGAFDDIEFAAIVTRLRAHGRDVLSVPERSLLWLQIAFGRNPFTYALMREDDYRPTPEVGTERIYHRFDIPQIKKRDEYLRADFDPKNLNQEVGAAVADLIADNARWRAEEGWPEGCAFPLFRSAAPQRDLLDGPLHEFAMHMTSTEITATLKRAMGKLDVHSHRTDGPLISNTRRFRRTFVTRVVEEGASPAQAAIAAGHTDLQNIGVYYETRANQVERLDAALATKLGPIADAFMGRIVDDEADAVNGGDPAKRIPWFRRKFGEKPQRNGELGTCGSGPCSLFAPVSCYTCAKFQPWKKGPHREVLDWLVEERDRKLKTGLDPQIVKIQDATILAVGNVVAACEGASQ